MKKEKNKLFNSLIKWSEMESKAAKGAIETFGKEAQIIMAMEEMSELIQALSKNIRGEDNVDNIAEEIADVSIMLEQMMIIFACSDKVAEWHKKKICKLIQKIKKAKAREKNAT